MSKRSWRSSCRSQVVPQLSPTAFDERYLLAKAIPRQRSPTCRTDGVDTLSVWLLPRLGQWREEPFLDSGYARNRMGGAAQDGCKVHGAGVVDDDVRACAKGIDQLAIDEAANIRVIDSVGPGVSRCCDDLDLVGSGEKFSELRYVRVLFGAPLRSDVNGDERRGRCRKLLLVKTFNTLPGNGCDRGPLTVAISKRKPAFRIRCIE